MKTCLTLAVLIVLMMFHIQPCYSQSNEELKTIKEEIKVLKEGQKAMQKELQDIKGLLGRKPAPEFKEVVISVDNNPVKGDKNAKLALIEFSDYQ